MARTSCGRIAAPALLTLLLTCVVAGTAAAQQGAVISGRVMSEAGNPIPSVTVAIPSVGLGAQSDEDGRYSLIVPAQRARGQEVIINARRIGFRPQEQQIPLSPGSHTVNFTMTEDVFRLGEIVVTGVGEATEQAKLTISVARLSEDQITAVPATSPISAIAGKVSGARVSLGRGNPGAAPTIRLRGSTNLGIGNSSPLIIVDGVITQNSIADIDANDIESIEVLKGAAAASYYGSAAANGVINITTKRGRNIADNTVSYTLRSEYGVSGLERYVPLNTSHAYLVLPDGEIALNASGERILDPDGIADNPYPTTGPNRWRNQLRDWTETGEYYSTNFQIGGRSGQTNFNTSFTFDRNAGVLPFIRGQDRQNFRLNVDQGIGALLDLSLSVTYGTNKNDYDPNGSTSWFELMQMPPDVNLRRPVEGEAEFYPAVPNPSGRSNPLYNLANDEFSLRRERIIGSVYARYRPLTWLRLEGSFGTDRLNRRESFYEEKGSLGEQGEVEPGSLERFTQNNIADNAQVSATMSHDLFEQLRTTTRLAALYEQARTSQFEVGGDVFVVAHTPDLGGLDPAALSANSFDQLARTVNYMVSQSFDLRDRYLLDLLVRRDGSSLFGPDARWATFYRVSGAWRISEDFAMPGIQELRLRAARGTAGLRPDFLDQYEYYSLAAGQLTKQQLGNRELEPAIQTENEFGLNVTFLDRFDFELVHARRVTEGAFLNVPLSPAQSGGYTQRVENAADVEANTTEMSLQMQVANSPEFSYSINLTGDHTTQRISRMDRAPFRVNAGGQGQDVFYYKEGEDLGIIYGVRWVRSFDELRQNPAFADADPADYVVNPLGYLVGADVRNTSDEKPIPFVNAAGESQHVIGNVNPDFSFGFANNIRWRNFGLYALFDGQQGGHVYNFTKQWMFQDQRHADMDMAGRAEDQKVPQGFFVSGLYNNLVASDYFVEDASFVKLRELSLSYTFSPRMLEVGNLTRLVRGVKVALIGRNLFTWTDYSGFDPEVTSGSDFNFRIDGFRYPNFRTLTGQVELTF